MFSFSEKAHAELSNALGFCVGICSTAIKLVISWHSWKIALSEHQFFVSYLGTEKENVCACLFLPLGSLNLEYFIIAKWYQVHFFFYMPYLVKLTPKKTIVDLYSKLHASVRIDQLCPKTHMITRHLHKITSKCKIQHVKYLLFFIFVKYYSRRNDLERNPVLPWCYNICLSCSLY